MIKKMLRPINSVTTYVWVKSKRCVVWRNKMLFTADDEANYVINHILHSKDVELYTWISQFILSYLDERRKYFRKNIDS